MENDMDEEEPIANGAPKKGRGRPPKTPKIGRFSFKITMFLKISVFF